MNPSAKRAEKIVSNPASVLMLLGVFVILMAIFLPLGLGVQMICGGLGFFTLITGIIVQALLVQN